MTTNTDAPYGAAANPNRSVMGPALVVAQAARGRWLVEAAWRDVLLEQAPPNWFALESDPRATRVKTGRGRTTWRVRIGRRDVYAKVYDDPGGLRSVLSRVFGSAAHREWKPARRALLRGIPIAPAIALGASSESPRRSVMIVQGIRQAATLVEAWRDAVTRRSEGDRRREAIRWIDAAARLWAMAHQRGFLHGDGHPANILVAGGESEGAKAWFIDARRSRLARAPLNRRRSAVSLAEASQGFLHLATRQERLRFLLRYLDLRHESGFPLGGSPGEAWKEWAGGIEAAAKAHRTALVRRRDRRLRGDGVYFGRIELPDGWRGMACLRLARRQVFPDAGVPERLSSDWTSLLRDWLSGLQTTTPAVSSDGVIVLARRASSWVESFWWRWTGSPCRRAFLQAHRLRHRDRPGPLPLCWLERLRAGGVAECRLIEATRADRGSSCVD